MNTTAQEQIDAYVGAVREALVGLPDETRRELLEDLPEHLAEVLAEGEGSLTERLGPPQLYAAELRAATGFIGGFPDPPPQPPRLAHLQAAALRHLDAADVRLGPLLGHARASEFLGLLRPAWWVLRGYLAAMVLAYLLDDSGQPIGLLPRIGGSEAVALLLLSGAVVASVGLGRRTETLTPWPRYALRSCTVLLVLAAFTLFLDADRGTRGSVYQDANTSYYDPMADISDVFVYDEQGRMLTGVRLFDQNGSPIRLGNAYCDGMDGELPPGADHRYPHCPENAPFRGPGGPAAEERPAVPSPPAATPGEAVGPSPSETPAQPTEPTVRPSPSVTRP